MITHVKVLGWLNIVWGSIILCAGLIVFLVLGGIAGIVGAAGAGDDRVVAIPLLGGIGSIVFVISLIVSLPSLIGGIGLVQWRPWARILLIITSALHLLSFPLGTALGAYGLWVLLNRDTEVLFQRAAAGPYIQPRPM